MVDQLKQKIPFSAFDARTLGDGDIIGATQQITNENGLTQFKIKLPSGREVESEWLRQEQLKKALLPWIETIRAELTADAEEVRAVARRESEERKASQKAPVLVSPSGDALTAESPPALPSRPARASVPPSTSAVAPSATAAGRAETAAGIAADLANPYEFARQGFDRAKQEALDAEDDVRDAMLRLTEAKQSAAKWGTILAALEGSKESNAESNISVDSGPVSRPRRGRPAGSRNKPKPAVATEV